MHRTPSENGSECAEIRELVYLYPGRALQASERLRVEEHLAGCPACAEKLRFAADFKSRLLQKRSCHPDAGDLVSFVENRGAVDPRRRYVIEDHLAVCAECRTKAAMLAVVDRDAESEDQAAPAVAHAVEFPCRTAWWGSLWKTFAGSLLRPVPAAVYLAIAAIAVGLYVWPTGERTAMNGGNPPVGGGGLFVSGGAIVLPDESGSERGPYTQADRITRIAVDRPQFLLLELIRHVGSQPLEGSYTVELSPEGADEPTLTASIDAQELRTSYTICLPLAAGAIAPGEYAVRVIDPNNATVYLSSFEAR